MYDPCVGEINNAAYGSNLHGYKHFILRTKMQLPAAQQLKEYLDTKNPSKKSMETYEM